jgi:hypothetical protein
MVILSMKHLPMKHLLVDISGHGFGHLAQASAVLNHLYTQKHPLQITIRTTLSEDIVRKRVHAPFQYCYYEQDRGMIMHSAIATDAELSLKWYQDFHHHYDERLQQAIKDQEKLKPDLLFSDIPYLGLDAASHLGIPSIAMCSLNWAHIFYAYCKGKPHADVIYEQILSAYNKALYFLQPEPSMPMPGLHNTKCIPPIGARGTNRRNRLLALNPGYTHNTHFVLVGLGGIPIDFTHQLLPQLPDVIWVMPDDNSAAGRQDCISLDQLDMSYIDILASMDLVLTKTGYGTQVEAVNNQTPIICIERKDWPEEPALFSWSESAGYFRKIALEKLQSDEFQHILSTLLQQKWEKPHIKATGDQVAADILMQQLFP